jgi:type II secretory pathway component GspD/PulD (secretin)
MHPHPHHVRPLLFLLGVSLSLAGSAIPAQAIQLGRPFRGRRQQGQADAQDQGAQAVNAQVSQTPAEDPHGKKCPSITISVLGNKLVVQSADPKVVASAQQLLRMLAQETNGAHFEIIRLQYANATEAAKILDEAFNGPKRPATPQPAAFAAALRRFPRNGNPPPAPLQEERVRVVADVGSNALLVHASPLDMLEVRRLVRQGIDVADTESKAVTHTWLIGPLRYATATEVADVLRKVYREQMNNNPPPSALANMPRRVARRLVNQNVDINGNPRAVSLSIGVDDRINSLALACSEALYHDINQLVDALEKAAKGDTKAVRIIRLEGINPAVIQDAINALQGRSPANRSGATARTANLNQGQGRANGR